MDLKSQEYSNTVWAREQLQNKETYVPRERKIQGDLENVQLGGGRLLLN